MDGAERNRGGANLATQISEYSILRAYWNELLTPSCQAFPFMLLSEAGLDVL